MDGIFAVRVRGVGNGHPDGRCGRASRVSARGPRSAVAVPLLEAHLFDFAGDLYGREIEVEFVARLRDELQFDSLDAMVEQMHRDAAKRARVLAAAID